MEGFSFPLDLEREIFETAAVRSRAMIPTLLRVCRRVHVWLEPLLYRVIGPHSPRSVSAAESKPATFLQNAVRHFLYPGLMVDSEEQWQTTLLSNCPDTTNLFIDGKMGPDLIRLLDKMHVQKLYLIVPQSTPDGVRLVHSKTSQSASDWTRSTLNHPLFQSVTHLSFYQHSVSPVPSNWNDWSPLASLPALTHLALFESLSRDILPHVIAECSGLVLAVTLFSRRERKQAARFTQSLLPIADPRAVVMVVMPMFVMDWIKGAEGGDDFWVRADAFVAQKRKGEIESTRYLLDEIIRIDVETWPSSWP